MASLLFPARAAAVAASPAPTPAAASLLDAFLQAERDARRPWSWPVNNCCHYGGRWVLCFTGAAVLVDGLADAVDAEDAGRRTPYGLARTVSLRLLVRAVTPQHARLGDLVMLASSAPGAGGVLGICGGRHIWLLGADGAPAPVPMSRARLCWPLEMARANAQVAA